MCLEAYINGFVQDHMPHLAKYIENIDIKAKWLSVPAFLGKLNALRLKRIRLGILSSLSNGGIMTLYTTNTNLPHLYHSAHWAL